MSDSCTQGIDRRRALVDRSSTSYGVDFVDVVQMQPPKLRVHLLGAPRSWAWLRAEDVIVQHATSERRVNVQLCDVTETPRRWVEFTIDGAVCPGAHRLTIAPPEISPQPDEFFASCEFHFQTPADATQARQQRPPIAALTTTPAEINYLAKDYTSFKQLLFDRLAETLPNWRERSPADVGVMLVELLAYEADYLSYFQDAVATEAYLNTCRLRSSLRRHARLMDYRVHEGCNARAWINVEVTTDDVWNLRDVYFLTQGSAAADVGPAWGEPESLPSSRGEVFEPVASGPRPLYRSHNAIRLYDWNGARSCLPRGTTSAALVDSQLDEKKLHLRQGDVVVFEQLAAPEQNDGRDGNHLRCHVARIDKPPKSRTDELTGAHILEISWHQADALPFDLWISDPAAPCEETPPMAQRREPSPWCVAHGNVILADHGAWQQETIDVVFPPAADDSAAQHRGRPVRALLRARNLTYCVALDVAVPATEIMSQDPRQAGPQIVLRSFDETAGACHSELPPVTLHELSCPQQHLLPSLVANATASNPVPGTPSSKRREHFARAKTYAQTLAHLTGVAGRPAMQQHLPDDRHLGRLLHQELNDIWLARADLLDSSSRDRHFVVESKDLGEIALRFGRDGHGQPPTTAKMVANFRVGNGTAGNVPSGAISRVGFRSRAARAACRVSNPLPAMGGVDPEHAEQVRLMAPHAIATHLARAVTTEDYEAIVLAEFSAHVQRAKATRRWTGHEWLILVAIDALGTAQPDETLLRTIHQRLRKYQLVGHTLRVVPAKQVALSLGLSVCVDARHDLERIKSALNERFSSRIATDGSRGMFHPDETTFGEGIAVSRVVTTASGVGGIVDVTVTDLARLDGRPTEVLTTSWLPLSPQEIARLDNDPAHPEHGQLHLELRGGR